jgi:uncharacterized protein YbjT (DUF2867 family)
MENILIAGANGTTGKKIVNLLKSSQYFNPVAMIRKEEQASQFRNEDIDVVIADLEKDLSHTLKNIDKVVFAAGSGGKKVIEVDQEGAKRLIDVSKMANIKKFVMLSSMGADQPDKAEDLKEYLKAKHNADEHLKSSGLNYTIVRPGALTNNNGTGRIKLDKSLNAEGEISRSDVAETLVRSLNDDIANKATFEILKGEVLISDAMNENAMVIA